jgi:hypothetical protein
MSIGAIWGVSNLVLEGKFSLYWENIKNNKLFWLLIGLYLLDAVGLLWSSNISYGLDDLRKKLPLLAIPLALCARPFKTKQETHLILSVFVSSVLLCTLINYFHFVSNEDVKSDVRDMSLFTSHIRFAMMVVLALLFVLHLGWNNKKMRPLILIVALWFLYYTYFSQVMTGILSLLALIYGLLCFLFYGRPVLRLSIFVLPFLFGIIGIYLFTQISKEDRTFPNPTNLPEQTKLGNPYYHDLSSSLKENGEFVYTKINEDELKDAWNKRSSKSYESKDGKEQELRFTLYRYLTYLHLPKDQEGMNKLSEEDIRFIELGKATPAHSKWGFQGRLADLKFQIANQSDPNGHSILQRLEYWKTGFELVKSNFWFGTGSGDVNDSFQEQYTTNQSKLLPEYRLRAHNTYLTQWVSLGIAGFVILLLMFWVFFKQQHAWGTRLFFPIGFIFLFTFFVEDTLETQAGVSLFALMMGLFACVPPSLSIPLPKLFQK